MQQDSGVRVRSELYEAVLLLASHPGSVETRLSAAFFSHLRMLDVSGLPASAQVQFEWVRTELGKMFAQPGVTDGVDRTQAILVAQSIIFLHYSLRPRDL